MIKTLRKLAPLVVYFTKNGGLNTVTGAAAVGFLPAVLEVLNNPAVDQGLDQLGGANEVGAVIAAVVIALRAGLGFWRMRRPAEVQYVASDKKKK